MIDYGIFEISFDAKNNEYFITEQLEGDSFRAKSLEEVTDRILTILKKVDQNI